MTMIRSVSVPSLGTVTGTIGATIADSHSQLKVHNKIHVQVYRGTWLWQGRLGVVTRFLTMLPWSRWWQILVIVTLIYKFIIHLLVAYYLDKSYAFLDSTIYLFEIVFILDVIIHLLHSFWPLLRLNVRVYRRKYVLLAFDFFSLLPFSMIARYTKSKNLLLFGRWLGILRIYRILGFFQDVNEMMHSSRKKMYFLEHIIVVLLVLHSSTCVWYSLHKSTDSIIWSGLGYPPHVYMQKLKFDSYLTCWYYCACRLFNCIFGDSFPLNTLEKWLTSAVMMFGYIYIRYRFIGWLAWEFVLENRRWFTFVEQYHHMIRHLKFRGAPSWLVEQTKQYKQQLWKMKDGILTTNHLNKLPLPLQMELIFDINVGHFHDSLLLRDTGESFMRHISLLIRHELYLPGQAIWNQGVIKSGMIFIKRGVIEMLSDEDDESPMIAFKEGTVLGEISLFYSIPSKVTVKAATYVELQELRRTDFMRAMTENPHMLQKIRDKVETRLSIATTKQTAIRKYDITDSRLIRTRYRPMKTLKDHLAGVKEEDSAFVDDSYMYYKDENDVSQSKFTTQYLELYKLSNNVTTFDEPRICLRSTFPWILEPDTDFTMMFDLLHFTLVLYVCIMSPYLAIGSTMSDWQRVLGAIVYVGLLLNIYIQLTTAIVDKNIKKDTVQKIAEEKMACFGFYLDVISVFPVSILTDTLDPNEEKFVSQFAVLLPALQIWHIWDYSQKWQNSFRHNAKCLCLAKFFLLFIIFCYWSGCFLYMIACPRKQCFEKSWMAQLIYWETKVLLTNDPKHGRPMTSSLALGTAVFTGTGMSDIAPGPRDFHLVIILFMLGTYLTCIYAAIVCSIYLLSSQRKLKFKESMRDLFYFLSVNHVSGKIKARVKKFFCVQWYYNNAVSNEEIFKDVSTNIQQEILSVEMIETLLCCPLFQDSSRDFLQTVATNTRTIVLPDNEIVQHASDIGRDMYIVKMGHCNMLNNFGKIVSTLGPGHIIGALEMLYGLPKMDNEDEPLLLGAFFSLSTTITINKVHTVLTTTNCILLHVEYSALVQCWSSFPDVSHPIYKALQDPEIRNEVSRYEVSKPLSGRIDAKTNRITQEIKESFVVLGGAEYKNAFDKLGILRFLRYIFVPGTITPHGIFLKIWCTIRFLCAVYYVITIPYNIATKQSTNKSSYNMTDILLYLDIVVMGYVAYYNEKSLLVTHPLMTVTWYIRHSFLLDLITVFPFEELCKIINEHSDLDYYRLNRILLVFRITGAFYYWEGNIMSVSQAVVLLKFLPVALTIVNFATAFIFVNSCKPYTVPNNSYILVNCTRGLMVGAERNIVRYAVAEYVNTFYWVFEIFIGCGSTPVTVSNGTDVWLTMCLQVTGLLYFAFMFGYIASTRSAVSHALLEHNEKTRDLANFLYQENVDPTLTVKTLKYFEYVWKRTHDSNPQKICRGLNSALMEDTLVFMYERALREVPLFGKVERSFIRVITQHLQEMYFLKGDTIVQYKDILTDIYIIYRGKVDVLSSYNEMITCMGPGGMFGNFSGQSTSCSEVSIYASRSLDLLTIPSQTFFNLIKYYPKVQEPLNKAFEISKDYILPISMDNVNDDSSSDTDIDMHSQDSAFETKSESSGRLETKDNTLKACRSKSNVSQAKSMTSIMTFQSYLDMNNLLRPGSHLFQTQGYLTCVMATANYVLVLYEWITLNDCTAIFWFQSFFDIYFYTKIYLSMHQGYLNTHGNLIIDRAKCRRRYFKHKIWVWIDIIINLPMEIFGFCFPQPLIAIHYLRINKLFRVKYMIEFYRSTSKELTNNLTTLQSAMTAFAVVLFIHTFTCTWLLTLVGTFPISYIRTLKMHLLDEDTPQRRWDYSTSLYVVVSELTGTGGDEFNITEIFSMVILAICLISGKILAATVVASSMQLASSNKFALNHYESITSELIDFLKNQGLSNYQFTKLWKYIRQIWVTQRGRQLPALLEKAPYVLKCDLMSTMFNHHLRSCYLFSETGETFLRQLAVLLDYTVFFPGNYIVVAGDTEARMHWVDSGTVAVVSVRSDLTETTHEMLHAGDIFGVLQGLNKGVSHCFSYRAETKVGILSLSLDSWMNILQYFPTAQEIIRQRSEILFTQI